MDRKLVLTNEASRHPSRQMLPPPELFLPLSPEPMSDRKLFLLTFCAAFMAFYGFLI
jgi:hypothetical protein